jgi:hypothetical protein
VERRQVRPPPQLIDLPDDLVVFALLATLLARNC